MGWNDNPTYDWRYEPGKTPRVKGKAGTRVASCRVASTMQAHYDLVQSTVASGRPSFIQIATYRIGQSEWIPRMLRSFLRGGANVQLLVGLGLETDAASKQTGFAVDPAIAVIENLRAIVHPEGECCLEIRTINDSHLKCWVFGNQRKATSALVGGRNLNFSKWADLTVEVGAKEANEIRKHFNNYWKQATEAPAPQATSFLASLSREKERYERELNEGTGPIL